MRRLLFIALAAVGCGGFSEKSDEVVHLDPERPLDPGDRTVTPYSGSDSDVLEAQATLATGYDFHRKVIQRSCSPTGGVCHNRKEFPDLHTPNTFLNNVGEGCNQVPKQWFTVFDRCERKGDRFRFEEGTTDTEIAFVENVPGEWIDFEELGATPTAISAGLHIYLRDGVLTNNPTLWGEGQITRDGLAVQRYQGRYWVLDNGKHLFAEVQEYQRARVEAIMATGLRFGDHNRNGVFGGTMTETVALLVPGRAEDSYLMARLRGHMEGQPVPGTRMPLANQVPNVPEMVALACFIEGLPTDGSPADMAWPIDYENCSWNTHASDLSLTGSGAPTWAGRVWPLLQANCGGCHNDDDPPAGLNIMAESAWLELQGPSTEQPALKRIEPGDPDASYLWRKLNGTPGITGDRMPPNRTLDPDELADIQAWIADGALN